MPKVVGIKFKRSPKVYYFEAGEYDYREGGGVVVETARGLEYGTVSMMPTVVGDNDVVQPLKPIVRLATPADEAKVKEAEEKRPQTMRVAAEKIEKSGLDMKLVDAEYTFDGSKLVIYFTADGRVDFRDLVKELASAFHIRIELRQIGARDECKMLGGIAPAARGLLLLRPYVGVCARHDKNGEKSEFISQSHQNKRTLRQTYVLLELRKRSLCRNKQKNAQDGVCRSSQG